LAHKIAIAGNGAQTSAVLSRKNRLWCCAFNSSLSFKHFPWLEFLEFESFVDKLLLSVLKLSTVKVSNKRLISK
jgi:hypothetical protein